MNKMLRVKFLFKQYLDSFNNHSVCNTISKFRKTMMNLHSWYYLHAHSEIMKYGTSVLKGNKNGHSIDIQEIQQEIYVAYWYYICSFFGGG